VKNNSLKQCLNTIENARLFIDAYNLVCNDPALSSQGTLEQSRELLRSKCGRYLSNHPGHVIYLVFDGDSSVGAVPDKSKNQLLNEKQGVREVFTVSGETADEWIVRLVGNLFPAENFFVITRDIELIRSVADFGVENIIPDDFLALTEEAGYTKRGKITGKRRSAKADAKCGHSSESNPAHDKKLAADKARQIDQELSEAFADNMDKPLTF
jgi:predicted RNA-binding protein with PIN domain